MSETAAKLRETFESRSAARAEMEPVAVTGLRLAALERFAAEGLPDRRHEDFKHTPVEALFESAVTTVAPEARDAGDAPEPPRLGDACRAPSATV